MRNINFVIKIFQHIINRILMLYIETNQLGLILELTINEADLTIYRQYFRVIKQIQRVTSVERKYVS